LSEALEFLNKTTKQRTKDTQDTRCLLPQSEHIALRQRLWALLLLIRPRQWTKNITVFIGIVFAQRLFNLAEFERTCLAFLTFCCISSCIYILNDICDIENDRHHPTKRKRPLASGQVSIPWALAALSGLFLGGMLFAGLLLFIPYPPRHDSYQSIGGANLLFVLTLAAYLAVMVLYNFWLKQVVLIDIFIIASGFVLRILGGAFATPVHISPWLVMVTCLLSLFLALSKRRNELVLLEGNASNHRKILKEYSIPMLDQMITIVVTCTIMAYSLYTVQGPTGNQRLTVTIPLVLYGIFRYLYLVYMKQEGGSPEEVLLRDRHLLLTVLICTILIIGILYVIPG
jgi:4-hydroxybenzoate polyprenyltransferase